MIKSIMAVIYNAWLAEFCIFRWLLLLLPMIWVCPSFFSIFPNFSLKKNKRLGDRRDWDWLFLCYQAYCKRLFLSCSPIESRAMTNQIKSQTKAKKTFWEPLILVIKYQKESYLFFWLKPIDAWLLSLHKAAVNLWLLFHCRV